MKLDEKTVRTAYDGLRLNDDARERIRRAVGAPPARSGWRRLAACAAAVLVTAASLVSVSLWLRGAPAPVDPSSLAEELTFRQKMDRLPAAGLHGGEDTVAVSAPLMVETIYTEAVYHNGRNYYAYAPVVPTAAGRLDAITDYRGERLFTVGYSLNAYEKTTNSGKPWRQLYAETETASTCNIGTVFYRVRGYSPDDVLLCLISTASPIPRLAFFCREGVEPPPLDAYMTREFDLRALSLADKQRLLPTAGIDTGESAAPGAVDYAYQPFLWAGETYPLVDYDFGEGEERLDAILRLMNEPLYTVGYSLLSPDGLIPNMFLSAGWQISAGTQVYAVKGDDGNRLLLCLSAAGQPDDPIPHPLLFYRNNTAPPNVSDLLR